VTQGDFQQDRFGGGKEAVDMFAETEDATVVSPDALENTIAVEQAVIEHADLRVLLVAVFTVDVDFHSLPGERYGISQGRATTEFGAGRRSGFRVPGSEFQVSSFNFQVSGGGLGTWNVEP
jgi:hypothetical protein